MDAINMAKRNIKSTIRNEVLKHADYLEEHSSRKVSAYSRPLSYL
jgi:hypothetical protein